MVSEERREKSPLPPRAAFGDPHDPFLAARAPCWVSGSAQFRDKDAMREGGKCFVQIQVEFVLLPASSTEKNHKTRMDSHLLRFPPKSALEGAEGVLKVK